MHWVSQQKDNNVLLDLEYVQLNALKVLALLNKVRHPFLCQHAVHLLVHLLTSIYLCAVQLFARRK